MIPQSFIDDLLFRLDIVDVVGRYVQLKPAGTNLQGLCPFHNEKSPSFTVSASKQFYHCFGCGAHGNAVGFVMEHLGLSFPEAVESLAGQLGVEVPFEKGDILPAEQVSEREQMFDLMSRAAAHYKACLKGDQRAVAYLKNRGLTGHIAARYGLGYSPDDYQALAKTVSDYDTNTLLDEVGLTKLSDSQRRFDRFRDRIMFPIRNGKGQIIGFGGRVLDKGEPKYLNSPETPLFSKGLEVYGLFEAKQAIHRMGYCLITEGYMDVVALSQWGFENAVATLGTAVTPDHVQKLFKQTRRLVFSFDGDKAGRKAAWRALEACLPHVTEEKVATFVFLPPEHDPDSFIRTEGADAFEFQVKKSLGLSEFLMQHLKDTYQIGQVEGNSAAMAFLKPLITQIPPTTYRVELLRQLADFFDQSPVQLASQLGISAKKSSDGQFFAAKGDGFKKKGGSAAPWGKKDPHADAFRGARPASKSPLLGLAARLIRFPQGLPFLAPLLARYERQAHGQTEVYSLLHLVSKVQESPERLEARLQHAFNDEIHQTWVDQAIQECQLLEESLDFETELQDSVYQCSEQWFRSELERLAQIGAPTAEQRQEYLICMQQFLELKQKRNAPKPS